ncbi:MAG: alpha/beta hydrolase [Acidimicrobiales bacterium]|nr:alpha/beta hydrolase [Acidimicrobiales bacterium]
MSVQDRIGKALARGQRRLPKAALKRRHGEPPTIDSHTLDLQIYAYASLIQAARARNAGTEVRPQTIRDGFDTMVAIGSGDPVAEVSVHDRTIPGPARDIPVRLYHPPRTSGRSAAIVWYHQGGGVIGGLDTDHTLCTMLSDACQAVVISVDYRLAPEHPFPADVVDSLAAYQWVIDHADGLGIDPARVAVAGTSQGGKLSAVVCQERRREGLAAPVAQILLYPGLDATWQGGSRDTMAEAWPLSEATLQFFALMGGITDNNADDRRASPGLETNLTGQPPALIVTAGFDPLRSEGDAYAAALQDANVSVVHRCEGELTHSFTVMGAVSKAAQKATERIASDAAALLADA